MSLLLREGLLPVFQLRPPLHCVVESRLSLRKLLQHGLYFLVAAAVKIGGRDCLLQFADLFLERFYFARQALEFTLLPVAEFRRTPWRAPRGVVLPPAGLLPRVLCPGVTSRCSRRRIP